VFKYDSLILKPGIADDARVVGFIGDYHHIFYRSNLHTAYLLAVQSAHLHGHTIKLFFLPSAAGGQGVWNTGEETHGYMNCVMEYITKHIGKSLCIFEHINKIENHIRGINWNGIIVLTHVPSPCDFTFSKLVRMLEEMVQVVLLCTQFLPCYKAKMSEEVRMLKGDGHTNSRCPSFSSATATLT
jgi:hypothetical protein